MALLELVRTLMIGRIILVECDSNLAIYIGNFLKHIYIGN